MSAAAGGGSFGAELDFSYPEECSFTFSETSMTNGGNSFFLETPPPPTQDGVSCSTEDVKIALKFLLSNVAAGIVIGKAGTNITLLQEVSGARIQLSRNNVFYPGTVERVLLLTGAVRSVLISLYLILVKLTGRSKWQAKTTTTTGESPVVDDNLTMTDLEGETTQVKIVMPAAVCGAIIGRGGETVRSFADDSGASISVSPQERTNRPDRMGPATDRIVTITGGVSQILRAVALIVTTVAEDPNYVRNVGLSVNYAPRPNTALAGGGGGGTPTPTVPTPHPTGLLLNSSPALLGPTRAASFSHSPTPSSGSFSQSLFPAPQDAASVFAGATTPQRSGSSLTGRNVEWKLPVPDEHVGAIIGKGGEILAQLQCLVGVKVTISGRGEFEPGTRNRVVAISGPPEAVKIGHIIITQKVNERIEQLQRQGSI
eukprot:g9249.t1